MIVTVVDTGLLLGPCPFRTIPSAVADVLALREAAGFDRAVAMGFRSLLYFDPIAAAITAWALRPSEKSGAGKVALIKH